MRFIFVCSICRTGFIGKEFAEKMTCKGDKTTPHPEVPMVVCGVQNGLVSEQRIPRVAVR